MPDGLMANKGKAAALGRGFAESLESLDLLAALSMPKACWSRIGRQSKKLLMQG